MKKILTLFAAAMLITACSNEDGTQEGNQPSTSPIAFEVTDNGSLTRALGEIKSSTDFQGTLFGVFASYTGKLKYENTTVSPDFMYNQPVSITDDGNWSYAPLKYWPNDASEYVSFFAYAPYEESPADDGRCIIDMSKWDDKGDPWLNYRLAADPFGEETSVSYPQVDLLYAVNEGSNTEEASDDAPSLDQQKPNDEDKVKFTFKHALGCVGDLITIQMSEALSQKLANYAELKVTSVKINYKNLTNKARLVLKCSSYPDWREIVSGQLTVSRTLKIENPDNCSPLTSTSPESISTGKGLFYIPLQVQGTEAPVAEVTLNYTVKILGTGTELTGVATGSFPLSLNAMEGKKQLDNDPATEPSYAPKF